jgi:hypothetical protein
MQGRNKMKKVFLASVAALSVLSASTAHAINTPDFRTFSNYALECESMAQNRLHLQLEIVPSEMTVKLHNSKGETFTFPITNATVSLTNTRNAFNHDVVVPYVAFVAFRDNGGKERMVMHRTASFLAGRYMPEDIVYIPGPANKEHWGYSCIPMVNP